MEDYDYLFKIVIIGEMGVGKSSILVKYTENKFDFTYLSTIGVDFKFKTITINNKRIKFQLWDTAGQERFRTITTSYYRGATAICLVFDLTNRKSFESLTNWLLDIKAHTTREMDIILVGNKADLIDHCEVSFDEIHQFANHHHLPYIETSAKNGTGIDSIFEKLSTVLMSKHTTLNYQPDTKIPLTLTLQPKSSSCFCQN